MSSRDGIPAVRPCLRRPERLASLRLRRLRARRRPQREDRLAARVVRLDAAEVRPGARLVGRELGVLRPPAISENFEGIAARRAPDGGVLLYLLSDDNFTPLLRSLLLQFSVSAPPRDPPRS